MIANLAELTAAVEDLYRPHTTAEVLEEMLEALEKGWTQGTLYDPFTGKVCLLGALNKATSGDARVQPASTHRNYEAYMAALNALKEAMDKRGIVGGIYASIWDRIPMFNDDALTTLEDVRLVVKEALANEGDDNSPEENCE